MELIRDALMLALVFLLLGSSVTAFVDTLPVYEEQLRALGHSDYRDEDRWPWWQGRFLA